MKATFTMVDPPRLGLAKRVGLINFALVALVVGLLLALMTKYTQDLIDGRIEADLTSQSKLVHQVLEATDRDFRSRTVALNAAFRIGLMNPLELGSERVEVAGKATPALRAGGQPLNNQNAIVDRFTEASGGVATVFARDGDDFVRIATSLKKEDGSRALGTQLDRGHPAYELVRQGKSYTGLATLFGKRYMTSYFPLTDATGAVVGIAFIGLDFAEQTASLAKALAGFKLGTSGYFYVLDATPGKTLGDLILHPIKQGQNILQSRDGSGRQYIRELLERKNGVMRYPWRNAERGETADRVKIVAFSTFEPWGWTVSGGTYVDEYQVELVGMRNVLVGCSLVAALLLGLGLYALLQRSVAQPLQRLGQAAQRLAAGDLGARVDHPRRDEVGELARCVNRIGADLAEVVRTVRADADGLAAACVQVAQGNGNLSQRTEQQAAAVEQTAASMQELGSSTADNTQHAVQADELARGASEVAQRGGTVVSQVVETMRGIHGASQRIADIIGVIDGIAFQTNILALNAAVEAARAGESGRGFAVVASEVRSLAGRSAEAAREIKSLINASVDQVTQGSALADEAGATMQAVVDSIGKVCGVVQQISGASGQQSSGIAEVGAAIGGIDQATQQNATLVQQVAATTAELSRKADDLVRAVAVFKLPG